MSHSDSESLCSFVQDVKTEAIFCEKCGKPLAIGSLTAAIRIKRTCKSGGEVKDCGCVEYRIPTVKPSIQADLGTGVGIVMPGGGPYLKSAWVSIRQIRATGCKLPIELWLLPWETVDENTLRVFSFFDVEFRTAEPGFCLDQTIDAKKWKRKVWLAGWQLKAQAVLQSRFSSVLYIDADLYPINRQAIYAITENKNTFLRDIPESDHLLPKETLQLFGVEVPPVDSGCFFLQKSRANCEYIALLNCAENAPYVYSDLLWGDKDTWAIALRLAGETVSVLGPSHVLPNFCGIYHPTGFIHRTGCKFTEGQLKNTPQQDVVTLPGDEQVMPFLKSWPLLKMRTSRDFELCQGPIELDEYRLASMPEPKTVIDAGAHIGSFSVAVKRRWPNSDIVAIEPSKENCDLYEQNTGRRPLMCALSDKQRSVSLSASSIGDTCFNTTEGNDVVAIPLSSVIKATGWETVDLLKLDIEGDEHLVIEDLHQTGLIKKVLFLRMEWHNFRRMSEFLRKLKETHHVTAYFHPWDHGYLEAVRNEQ